MGSLFLQLIQLWFVEGKGERERERRGTYSTKINEQHSLEILIKSLNNYLEIFLFTQQNGFFLFLKIDERRIFFSKKVTLKSSELVGF